MLYTRLLDIYYEAYMFMNLFMRSNELMEKPIIIYSDGNWRMNKKHWRRIQVTRDKV